MPKPLDLILRTLKRITVFVFGSGVVVLGVVLIPLPGPGLLVVILGLAVLASEFTWAQRALDKAQRRAQRSGDAIRLRWRMRRGVADELSDGRHRARDERAVGG
jgi:uncharacterized protein (TIGR02611 family)